MGHCSNERGVEDNKMDLRVGKERKDKNSVVWKIRPQIGKKKIRFFSSPL